MAKVGRPKAMTKDNQARFCDLIRVGITIERAATVIGCRPLTVIREARRNAKFKAAWERARITAISGPLKTIYRAAQTDVDAAKWLVKRMR